jgi:hypothetical protein
MALIQGVVMLGVVYAECRKKPFLLNAIMLSVIELNVIMLTVIMMYVVMLSVIMQNVIMLSVIILNVIMLNGIMLNVIMPCCVPIGSLFVFDIYELKVILLENKTTRCRIIIWNSSTGINIMDQSYTTF